MSLSTVHSLYRDFAARLPHGALFIVGPDLRYLLAEGPELAQVGMTPAAFEGRLVGDMVPPALREQAERDYRTVLDGGTFTRQHEVNQRAYQSYGIPLRHDGGGPLALVVSYAIEPGSTGGRALGLLNGLSAIMLAVHTHAEVADALREVLMPYLGSIRVAIVDVHGNGPRMSDRSGYFAARGLGQSQALANLGQPVVETLRRGQSGAFSAASDADPAAARFLAALGFGSGIAVPRLRDGRLAGILIMGRPTVTRWTLHERSLADAAARHAMLTVGRLDAEHEVALAERRTHEVFALLGHELRNPVAALANGLEVLKHRHAGDAGADDDGAAGRDERAVLDSLQRQVVQIRGVVEDLLGVAFVQFGKFDLRTEPLDLESVIDGACAVLLPAAQKKGQLLTVVAGAEPCIVQADRGKMVQVLTNLVGNAIKYTPAGGTITVTAGRAGRSCTVTVADNGQGIDAAMLPYLFDLFSQGGESTSVRGRRAPGLGIGLWIVRKIVDAHGGAIEVRSPGRGRGSVFTISLPVMQTPA